MARKTTKPAELFLRMRLTKEDDRILAKLQKELVINRTAVVRLAIRELRTKLAKDKAA